MQEGNAPEPGRPCLARSRRSDPGPRQEVEKAKLSGNRRGVGWVHSTGETLEQSREERWRRGRREGTQSEEEVDAEARPGHSAGYGVSQEAPIHGSNLNGPSQAPKIDHVRPPTRARCGQAARRDLWGRCRVTGTSTRQPRKLEQPGCRRVRKPGRQ